ncbi:transglycosylase family protein [Kitasatospora sp. GP82]|uniref:LysM peptidoglycan-binding domain-containing protein n=1 Tax=Kitasatospora sp. GP82 TaxID=3035089 RepID=UPI002473E6E6|nr:transglycosylase family protein [Kitasatospora sp. GP82]MDH6128313.1 LysM repeat protein [Kitasatospora sp. GP82]
MVFSGSGRHRRPTQADRAVAAAGVASVGLALPLLTAAGAHAAPASTWDSVAQCASGGNWAGDDGNGHYGGLQMTQRTWVTYGGDKYAAEPDHATRSEQIAVAERVLADVGPGAWPHCAAAGGLAGGTPAPAATATPTATPSPAPSATTAPAPAPTATPAPSAPDAGSSSTGQNAHQPTFPGMAGWDAADGVYWYQDHGVWHWTVQHDVYIQHMDSTGADASAQPSAPATTAPSPTAPAAPASPQPSQAPQAPGSSTPSSPASQAPSAPAAGSATTAPQTPGTSATAPSAPTAPTAPTASGTSSASGAAGLHSPQTYTVEHGDTLSGIAETHQLPGWQHLYEDNKATIGNDPNLIVPGQALHLAP